MSSLQDENNILRQELHKVEDYLANARAERDDLIVKYNALNDRVSKIFAILRAFFFITFI